jgi:hypothetical protein
MRKTIEQHKRWKDDPSKGEVFTPEELVREMLDKIPVSVWENPKSTFLDPCMGRGTFLIDILRRLTTIYGYSKEDAMSRIYGYDVRVKYSNYLQRGGFINVFHKDFLNDRCDMKFDVVVGNPPYQDSNKPGDNALYQHFTKKVLDEVLKEGGYFSFVLPTTMSDYLLLCEKNRNYIKYFYNIKSMVFDYPEEYFKNMGVGTTAFFFTLKNEILSEESQDIEFTYKEGNEKKVVVKKVGRGEILPKKNFGRYEETMKLFLSDQNFDFKVMKTNEGKFRRIRKQQLKDGTVSSNPTNTNIYPILDKITKTQGFTTYFYSQTMVDYDKPKLVFCKSGYPMATYIDEPMNLSDNMMYYLPINEIEGRNLEFIINSEVFGQAIQMFSTNARDAHKTIVKLKKIDLSVTPLENEDQILEIFRR